MSLTCFIKCISYGGHGLIIASLQNIGTGMEPIRAAYQKVKTYHSNLLEYSITGKLKGFEPPTSGENKDI